MKNIIKLSEKELQRIPILDEIILGIITESEGANRMSISTRQTRRLLKAYKSGGWAMLAHKLRGVEGNRSAPYDIKLIKQILTSELFTGFKPLYVSEKLHDLYDITISKESVRKLMIQRGLREARHQNQHTYRMRRPRVKRYGIMVQFDGSYHDRLENGEIYCLLVAIDDATGKLIYMQLCDNEGFDNVGNFWKGYISQHGVPEKLYIDKFSTYKVNYPKATYEKDLKTHFSRAMQELGCEVIYAHSPQAKGRVERVNQTLQDRLIKEMRLAKIKTLEQANIYIQDYYIPYHNDHFSIKAQEEGDAHHSNSSDLNWIFTRRFLRKVSNDMCIQYENNYYQILKGDYKIYAKMTVEVRQTIGKEIRLQLRDKTLHFEQIPAMEVKLNRAKQRNRIRLQKELQQKEREEARRNERHRISKQKQLYYQQKNVTN